MAEFASWRRVFSAPAALGVMSRPALWLSRLSLTRFALVGATGVAVNTLALMILYQGARLPLLAASPLSVELAITSNFLLNDRWTFGRPRPSWRRFLQFNVAMVGVMVMTAGLVWLLVTSFHLQYLLANLAAITVAGLLNFAVSTAWIWGRKS
jgi:dolichol-phosphate mannosyltransferase